MQLVFASNNKHKIKEINDILGSGIQLLSLGDIKMEEDIPEDEHTLEGNALDVFADDTGLEVDYLDGQPGVHSARFAGPEKDSGANIEKLLLLLGNTLNRRARFRTVIALISNGSEYLFEGTVNGTITGDRRGLEGFGYDPVFIPDGYDLTFAEMSLSEKNRISHRAMAFGRLKEFLEGNQ